MNDKVKLPKEVAEAIDYLRLVHQENVDILSGVLGNANTDLYLKLRKYTQTNFDTFLTALVNGYEVEQTPEDKVRDQYAQPRHFLNKDEDTEADIYRKGIKFALDTLNIKIEGINT